MKIKSYTDKKQSEMLLRLGIDPKTADMHYNRTTTGDYIELGHSYNSLDTPAWSLPALINLMPLSIHDEKIIKCLHIGYRGGDPHFEYVVPTKNAEWYPEGYRPVYESSTSSECKTWIDAAVEEVIWLLKNDYIKSIAL